MRKIRFGDERDLCFSCERPFERCGHKTTHCTLTEATQHDRNLRHKTDHIQQADGISEPVLDVNYGY